MKAMLLGTVLLLAACSDPAPPPAPVSTPVSAAAGQATRSAAEFTPAPVANRAARAPTTTNITVQGPSPKTPAPKTPAPK